MTTSDKITHVMDVLFFIGLVVLVMIFAGSDREHEKQIASLEGSLQKLQGQVTLLEGKLAAAGSPAAPGAEGTTPAAPVPEPKNQ